MVFIWPRGHTKTSLVGKNTLFLTTDKVKYNELDIFVFLLAATSRDLFNDSENGHKIKISHNDKSIVLTNRIIPKTPIFEDYIGLSNYNLQRLGIQFNENDKIKVLLSPYKETEKIKKGEKWQIIIGVIGLIIALITIILSIL